jgi:hypothetical protein
MTKLKKLKETMGELPRRAPRPEPRPAPRRQEWSLQEKIEFSLDERDSLTPWERKFILSVSGRRHLSDEQMAGINRLFEEWGSL